MAHEQVVDAIVRHRPQHVERCPRPFVVFQIDFPQVAGHRREVIDPLINAASCGRGSRARKRRFDCVDQNLFVLGDRSDVVSLIEQQMPFLQHREDVATRQKQIRALFEQRFPLPRRLRQSAHSRLVIDPVVEDLAVQQRAIEAFDDPELRIDARFDRILTKKRLAE